MVTVLVFNMLKQEDFGGNKRGKTNERNVSDDLQNQPQIMWFIEGGPELLQRFFFPARWKATWVNPSDM
jgi:hypothetical protein